MSCNESCAATGRSRLVGREVVCEVVCDSCGRVLQETERTSLSPDPIFTRPPEEEN